MSTTKKLGTRKYSRENKKRRNIQQEMARRKRRRKIRKSQMRGRENAQKEYESKKDVQTVTGQALCDISQFEEEIAETAQTIRLKREEVIIDESELHVHATPRSPKSSSWLRWLLPTIF